MSGEPSQTVLPGEYRIEELAWAAGLPVRTVRYYRERRLLPPPRRAGRFTVYSEAHLARLRVIGRLLRRGHTLDTVAQLLSAWEQGHGVGELIGLEQAMTAPWSQETPVEMSLDELAGLFGGEVGAAELAEAVDLGYVRVEGDRVTAMSRRLLETTVSLVREGVPLPAVLGVARRLQRGLDEMADLFVRLVSDHVLAGFAQPLTEADLTRITEAVERLRPLARVDIDVEFGRAMDRAVGRALERALGTAPPPETG